MSDMLGLQDATRLLVDPKGDARQRAAQGVAQRAAALFRKHPWEEACSVLVTESRRIQQVFMGAVPATYRRAGMIAIKAIISGLPSRTYTDAVVVSYAALVGDSMVDADPVVRVAALEAAHQLVRRFQRQMFGTCFKTFFRALSCAIGDADTRVNALAQEVSLSLKEALAGSAGSSSSLDVRSFISFVRDTLTPFSTRERVEDGERAYADSAAMSAPIVSWILDWMQFVLDNPQFDSLQRLPEVLPVLLRVASNYATPDHSAPHGGLAVAPRFDVRPAALQVLRTCREEVVQRITRNVPTPDMEQVISILTAGAHPFKCDTGDGSGHPPRGALSPSLQQLCLEWLDELVLLAGSHLHTADNPTVKGVLTAAEGIVAATLVQLASPAQAVSHAAERLNRDLSSVVLALCEGECASDSILKSGDIARRIAQIACSFVLEETNSSRGDEGGASEAAAHFSRETASLGAVRWLALFLRAQPSALEESYGDVRDTVVVLLCGPLTNVRCAAADVTVTLAGPPGSSRFHDCVEALLFYMKRKAPSALPRLPAVLRSLQTRFAPPENADVLPEGRQPPDSCQLLVATAAVLSSMATSAGSLDPSTCAGLRFVNKAILAANAVLMTSEEFVHVRAHLRACPSSPRLRAHTTQPSLPSYELFLGLYGAWQYNAVALLSLCFLSNQDELALGVCTFMGALEMSAATLVQLDRLVQMLESPVFADLRMRLLHPRRCGTLVQALYAVLMLLPLSSPQYATLHQRLSLVSGLLQLEALQPAPVEEEKDQPVSELLDKFKSAQARVFAAETEIASHSG